MINNNTKRIAVCAVFSASALVLNFLSTLFPSVMFTILAVSGLVTAFALSECGCKYSLLLYAATSILSFFLLPDKKCVVFYVLLFGHYPITKLFLERIEKCLFSWIIKLFCINILLTAVLSVCAFVLGLTGDLGASTLLVIVPVFNIAFVIYDIFISWSMRFYNSRRHL